MVISSSAPRRPKLWAAPENNDIFTSSPFTVITEADLD